MPDIICVCLCVGGIQIRYSKEHFVNVELCTTRADDIVNVLCVLSMFARAGVYLLAVHSVSGTIVYLSATKS